MRVRIEKDLVLILGALLLLALSILAYGRAPSGGIVALLLGPLRLALAIPLVAFVPGYLVAALVAPRRGDFAPLERVAVSVGVSVLVFPAVGILLNFTSFGITLHSTLVAIVTVETALVIAVYMRRRRFPEAELYRLQLPVPRMRWPDIAGRGRLGNIMLNAGIGGAALLAVAAASYAIAAPNIGERYSEFFVVGEEGHAQYPRFVDVGAPLQLAAGIVNHEMITETYRVVWGLEQERLGESSYVTLADGEREQIDIRVVPSARRSGARLWLDLYRSGGETPYRSLYLWLDVVDPDSRFTALMAELPAGSIVRNRGMEFQIELFNHEGQPVSYSLRWRESWSGKVRDSDVFTVADREVYRNEYSIFVGFDPEKQEGQVEVLLYREGSAIPYQTTSIPVHVNLDRVAPQQQ